MTAPPWLEFSTRLRPYPKGSLVFVTRSYVKESNRMTKPTMDALALQLRAAKAGHARRREFPLSGGVELRVDFFFARADYPWAGPLDRPTTTDTGDVDKLLRLVCDALTKGGVITDDALIVDVLGSAWFADHDGMRIRVGPARAGDGSRP